MKKKLLLLSSFVAICIISFAQPNKVTADKIIGVIGNKLILKSDVEDRLLDIKRQGGEVPENGKCFIMQELMGTKTLVLQAEKDSLPVTDEDVESDVDNRIRQYLNQFGGKEELEKIAGKTVYQLKEDMRDPIKDQKLAAAMRNKIVGDIRITPFEVKKYFSKIPTDSLPLYESEVEIGQLINYPRASRDAEDYCKEQLAGYKVSIETGKLDFKRGAALYSDEPGAKERFGQMEINREQRDIDPTFMAKAFTLKEGQISNPFKSKFGYHIIQLVSRNGNDAVVRHIIKIPQVTAFELKDGFEKLDTARAKLIAGTIDFGGAIAKYSNDENSKFTAGMMQSPSGGTFLTIDQLDKDVLPILNTLKPGGYSQPLEFTDAQGKRGVRIIYLKTKTEPHRENLKDDYSKISEKALAEKKEDALGKWFSTKLGAYYIMLDPEYSNCESLKVWTDAMGNKK
ncbi:MAG: peptidylprolyl isomerase [Ferruginibacter sp.]|nr:peptidylprolyl isomerase [Ferruginibacter sp.]